MTTLERALALFREANDRQGEAYTLGAIGRVFHATGRYSEALRYFQESLKLSRELNDRQGEANTLGAIGDVYRAIGRYAESLRYLQDSRNLHRTLGVRAGEADALEYIGRIYHSTGRYAEALRHFQDSLRLRREIGDRAGVAVTLASIGHVYLYTGRYSEALRHYQDDLKPTREIGARAGEANALDHIGNAHYGTGSYAEALRYYLDSLKIQRELGTRASEVNVLRHVGNVYVSTGRYAEALPHYQDSLKLCRELGDRQGEADTLNNIGYVYDSTGQHTEALRRLTAALTIAEEIGESTTTIFCYWSIGRIHLHSRRWQEAAASYRRAIALIEQVRADSREQSLQTGFFAQFTSPYNALSLCLLELGRAVEAFAIAERAKARALLDALKSGKVDVRKNMTDDERLREQQLQEHITVLIIELENLRSRKLEPKRQEELTRELERARQDYDAFRRDLFLRLPELQTRRAVFTPATLTDLNPSLFAEHPRLAVLSYLVADNETVLFVLTRGDQRDSPARLAVHRIQTGEKELAEAVEQFRAACQKPGAGTPDGAELYRLLLAPVEDLLAEASHVVVLPDGVLHTLPFHALKDVEEGKYLIERCAVSYAPSATALVKMMELGDRRRKGAAEGLLAAGICDFGRRERALPNAEGEARAVAALFAEQAQVLLGREASKANLRAAWSGRHRLHFATHGRLNEAVPLYSAVVLSQSDGGRDEGLLFACDLLDEELAAELVVLSACETGLGKRVSGEGLLGMTWAWFVAGVPSTVASQWSVADQSTARLMQAFYAELRGGASKAVALRRAQLALLNDRKTRHPFYWAPFALTGDPW
jgi:CHAT domain-containing protein